MGKNRFGRWSLWGGCAWLLFACNSTPSHNLSDDGSTGSLIEVGGACDPAACVLGYTCVSHVCVLSGSFPATAGSCAAPNIVSGGKLGPATAPTVCLRPVVNSTAPSSWIQTFGVHTVGDVISFSVPPNTQSLTLMSQAVSSVDTVDFQGQTIPNAVVPTLVTGPDSTVYFDDNAPAPADPTTALISFLPDAVSTGVMGIPNSTAMLNLSRSTGLPSGTWKMTVNDFAFECASQAGCDGGSTTSTYNMQVVAKPGPAQSHGTLDIAFYLIDTDGLNATTAVNDPHVKRMLATLEDIYAQAGICLGTLTFYELPDWAQQKYFSGVSIDNTPPCDELSQLFVLSIPGNALNIFLVPTLLSSPGSGGTQVVGIDGTIPGPSSYGGGVVSGAAVSIADLNFGTCGSDFDLANCGADEVAYVTAHESGHWLGLRHTTEQTGFGFDPLVDTGTCGCETCATNKSTCLDRPGVTPDTAHVMMGPECSLGTPVCSGGENLMFWLIQRNSRGLLTPEQGEVIRSNLAVR